jgi:hypothetical protein
VADPKKPRAAAAPPMRAAPPPPAHAPADPGASLEELNDQLGRFLQHADQLVDEWARFGADVRRTVDTEVGRIDQAVVDAVDRAARQVNAQVDKVAADRVERAIDQGMQKLRAELTRGGHVATGGGGTSAAAAAAAAAQGPARYLLGAIVLADLLLVILLVMVWRREPAPAAGVKEAGAQIGTLPEDAVAPEVANACAALAAGTWSIEFADLVLAAGPEQCGTHATAVRALLHERLAASAAEAVDAGVPDGPPPDAPKPKRPPK